MGGKKHDLWKNRKCVYGGRLFSVDHVSMIGGAGVALERGRQRRWRRRRRGRQLCKRRTGIDRFQYVSAVQECNNNNNNKSRPRVTVFFLYVAVVVIDWSLSNGIISESIRMTSRSKEKVTAMFRKIFKSSGKEGEGPSKATASGSGSPARRLLRGCRDSVSPAPPPGSPGFTTTKPSRKPPEEPPSSRTVRARRLMKEFKDLQRLQHSKTEPVFTVELVDDNLFEWHVRIYKLDPESDLGGDMKELGINHILLHLIFPENFPFAPPFMRVISPRIEKGFVMEGGAICMELLTPRGWASAYTVEAVIMQFAASVVKGQGRVQRKSKGQKVFSKRSAEESFRSLVKTHEKYGWVTPSLADG